MKKPNIKVYIYESDKRYKVPGVRAINTEDVMYNVMTTVNWAVWYF